MFLKGVEYTRSLTADQILVNMREIAKNDMIQRVGYYDDDIARPDLAESGAICGGHQACAVGSLYLAASVMPKQDGWYDDVHGQYHLGNVNPSQRRVFMAENELISLSEAYRALNDAAREYISREGLYEYVQWESWRGSGAMETLFESRDYRNDELDKRLIEPDQLLPIIDRAREIVAEAS